MPADIITLRNISKSFGAVRALEDVSFAVKKGQIAGLIGPNGAGKTTLVRLVMQLLQADSGCINIETNTNNILREIGYLPEQAGIYNDLNVYEFLQLHAQSYNLDHVPSKIEEVAAKTGCEEFIYRPMGNLSKGMRQRALLAACLIHNPQILILDEPTDGLDPNQKEHMRSLLRQLAKQGKTIIISTHLLEEAESLCTSVFVLNRGRLVADTTPQDLKKKGGGSLDKAFRDLTDAKEITV